MQGWSRVAAGGPLRPRRPRADLGRAFGGSAPFFAWRFGSFAWGFGSFLCMAFRLRVAVFRHPRRTYTAGLAAGIPGFSEEAEVQVQAQQGEAVNKTDAHVESQFAHQVVGVVLLGR